jgi:hypothetical protein
MIRTLARIVCIGWLGAVGSAASAFEFAGLGSGVDPQSLRERFPASKHEFWQRGSGNIARPEEDDGRFDLWLKEGEGLYIIKLAPDDSRADVTAVSISMDKGKVRRWILSFERVGVGKKPEQMERRYPTCRRVLDTLVERYGEPGKFDTHVEEGIQHRTRNWSTPRDSLTLDCGKYTNRKAVFAIDLEITPGQ